MSRTFIALAAAVLFVAAGTYSRADTGAEEAPRIAREEVKPLLDDPDVSILDARLARDWKSSGRKIRNAVRVDPLDVGVWAAAYPKDRKLIVYCS